MLLAAIVQLDAVARTQEGKSALPKMLFVVTGKGPQKAMYEAMTAAGDEGGESAREARLGGA